MNRKILFAAISSLLFTGGAIAQSKGHSIDNPPPGWSQGEKTGWSSDIPPGLEKKEENALQREQKKEEKALLKEQEREERALRKAQKSEEKALKKARKRPKKSKFKMKRKGKGKRK